MSPASPTRRLREFLIWQLATWAALAAIFTGLRTDHDVQLWAMGAMALGIPGMLFCTWKTLRWAAGSPSRGARLLVWSLALAGLMALIAVFLGAWESAPSEDSRQLLALCWVLPALMAGRGLLRVRRAGPWTWIKDALGACAMLGAMGGAAVLVWNELMVGPLEKQAAARWLQIGRPLAALEPQLQPEPENPSLGALLKDLQPLGIASLYKFTDKNPDPNPSPALHRRDLKGAEDRSFETELTAFVSKFSGVLEIGRKPGDAVAVPEGEMVFLKNHEKELTALYTHILGRPAARWAFEPEDGFAMRVPNFLKLRILAQFMEIDGVDRLSRGDTNGAAQAIQAGLKISETLKEQPILVSAMIRLAIEALFAPGLARLPAEPGALEALAGDLSTRREAWRQAIEAEAWLSKKTIEEPENAAQLAEGFGNQPVLRRLPTWMRIALNRQILRRELALGSLSLADTLEISSRPETWASADLGMSAMEESLERHPSILTPSYGRSWTRLHLVFLIREQTEILRLARSQMAAGIAPPPHASAVVPGSTWTIRTTADSLALELSPRPAWTTDTSISGKDFFLTPLDGSVEWKVSPSK